MILVRRFGCRSRDPGFENLPRRRSLTASEAYCDLNKLEGQVKAAAQKNDTKTLEALSKQAAALIDKLGPEYYKLVDDLDEADLTSSEANEFMSILSKLDKSCTN